VNIVGVTPHSWRRNMVRRPRVLAAAPFQYPTPTGPLKSEGIPRQTA
jgi:hypothetical protein